MAKKSRKKAAAREAENKIERSPVQSAPAAAPEPFAWERRHTVISLSFILTASLVVGIIAVIQFMQSPFFNLPIIDEESYVTWGKEIAGGNIWGDKIFYQDPLYPYFIGLVFSIFGESHAALRLAQVLMGTAAVAVTYWAAMKLMGERRALLAACVMASYRGLYFFEILLLKATMVILFSALCVALGVAAADRPERKKRWLALGLCLGLLTLLRGNFQALIPFVIAWSFFFRWKDAAKVRLTRAALVTAGLFLIFVPVTLRNYAVGGEFVLTTSQGGANFFIGNNERANGRYATLPFVRANPKWESMDFEAEAKKRSGVKEMSPSQVSGFWFKESFDWIAKNPGKALKLTLFKARLMIHQHEIPDNHSFYLTRDLFVPAFWLPVLGFGLLWGPALIGVVAAAKKDDKYWFPALFAVLYAGSIIPFFIVSRYRLAVVPSLAIFSAYFVFWVREKIKSREYKWPAAAVPFLALSLWLGFGPTSVSTAPMGMEYYLLGNGYLKTDHPAEAIPWYDKAHAALPNNADIMRNRSEAMLRVNSTDLRGIVDELNSGPKTAEDLLDLARRTEQAGQTRMAIKIYELALSKDPKMFSPHARLGYLYTTAVEARDLDKAVKHMKAALELRPDDLDTMNAMGNVLLTVGDTVQAKEYYQRILAINPNYEAARKNISVIEAGSSGGDE